MATAKKSAKKTERKQKKRPQEWEKGQSGNPNGRPKRGETWADIINRVSEELHGKSAKTKKQAIIENVIRMALGKDKKAALAATKYLSERTDGKPAETVSIKGVVRDERLKDIPDDQLLKMLQDAEKTN